MKRNERYRKLIDELTLMDDILMNFVFDDQSECVRQLLLPILKEKSFSIISVRSQSIIQNTYGKDVRLDILAKDDQGRLFDIEMQQDDHYAPPERTRYYSSMLDLKHISDLWQNKGVKNPWLTIPETYVIFFTKKDHFKENEPVYHIDRCIREKDCLSIRDKQHIICINCSYENKDTDIGRLIHDLRQSDPDPMFNKTLSERVKYIKEDKEGGDLMCEAVQKLMDEMKAEGETKGMIKGEAQGRADTLKENIRSLFSYFRSLDTSVNTESLIDTIAAALNIDRQTVTDCLN